MSRHFNGVKSSQWICWKLLKSMIDRHETRILVVLHLWLLIIKRWRSVQIFISKQNFTVNCPHTKTNKQPSISYKCFQYHCSFILCDVFLDRLTNIYAVDIKQSRIWTKSFTNLEKLWTHGQVWTRSWGIFTSHLKCKTYKCPRCQCYVFMCLLYFVPPRVISSNILWLYLVSSCFILSCHVQYRPYLFILF